MTGDDLTPDQARRLAAYLGHPPARAALGAGAPAVFSLRSMRLGGDRAWRAAMRVLGHAAAADAARAVAGLAADAFAAAPDAPAEVGAFARDAVAALRDWPARPRPEDGLAGLSEECRRFCLAVDVGGELRGVSGPRARSLGRVVGLCWGVVSAAGAAADNNRRYVRWLGEAAEAACRLLVVPEGAVTGAVAAALLPYAAAAGPSGAADLNGGRGDNPPPVPPPPG